MTVLAATGTSGLGGAPGVPPSGAPPRPPRPPCGPGACAAGVCGAACCGACAIGIASDAISRQATASTSRRMYNSLPRSKRELYARGGREQHQEQRLLTVQTVFRLVEDNRRL